MLFFRWKQPYQWELTGKSWCAQEMAEKIKLEFKKVHEKGLNILCLTTDMSTQNVALWNALGLPTAGKSIQCKVHFVNYFNWLKNSCHLLCYTILVSICNVYVQLPVLRECLRYYAILSIDVENTYSRILVGTQ